MNDQHIDDLFDQDIPSADSNAKKIAINSAVAQFSKEVNARARLTDNRGNWFSRIVKSIGSYLMTPQQKPRFTATFASIAVAFVALSVFLVMPNMQEKTTLPSISNNKNPTIPESIQTKNTVDTHISTEISQVGLEQNKSEAPSLEGLDIPFTDSDSGVAESYQYVKPVKTDSNKQTSNPTSLSDSKSQPKKAQSIQQSHTKSFAQNNTETVVVRGTRATIQSSIDQKRISTEIVDGLSADEIGDIPASSIAEALATIGKTYNTRLTEVDHFAPQPSRPDSDEGYAAYKDNTIKLVSEAPVSTFSIDVDTASYSLIRNQLNRGYLPNPQAVRAEELINYFNYNYPLPTSKNRPFKPTVSVLNSPWNKGKKLVHIGIKGYDIAPSEQPDSNLVFLLDVSGSMSSPNKLPLVKQSINLLLDTLKPTDTISIVVYAGAAGVVLKPTHANEKTVILSALNRLSAGGSTTGGKGIELAYQLAEQNFNKNSVNRIILATDGDFNVGVQSNEALKTLVERKRDNGVFLSILGFGRNNYQDDMMQTLAQNGNGVAAYIDTLSEAKKVLVDESTSTLFTIAKDVKIQVEFNPETVSEYRLIGYETRILNREDFNNDKVDAGDIGAGHTVTAIYEITPSDSNERMIDKPRYSTNDNQGPAKSNDEYGFVKIRYKSPTGSKSTLIEQAIDTQESSQVSSDVLFSTSVAGFAQLLTGGKYTADLSYKDLINQASKYKGDDNFGYRAEFIQLIRMAEIAQP